MVSDEQIRGMTNRELAENLRDAECGGDADNIVYFENEICVRLNLPLEQTEQGLTREAADAITKFCHDNEVI